MAKNLLVRKGKLLYQLSFDANTTNNIYLGVCRCVAKDTGEPIQGIETDMAKADEMDCKCSRESNDLKELGCGMRVQWNGDSSRSKERYKKAKKIRVI